MTKEIALKDFIHDVLEPEVSFDQGKLSVKTPIGQKQVAETYGLVKTQNGDFSRKVRLVFHKNMVFFICNGVVIQRYKVTTIQSASEIGYGDFNDSSFDEEAVAALYSSDSNVALQSTAQWKPTCMVFAKTPSDRMKIWVMGRANYAGVSFEWDAAKGTMTCSDPSVVFSPERMMWASSAETWYTHAPSGTYNYYGSYDDLSKRKLVVVKWINDSAPRYENVTISWDTWIDNFAEQVKSGLRNNVKWKYEIYENSVLLASDSYGM